VIPLNAIENVCLFEILKTKKKRKATTIDEIVYRFKPKSKLILPSSLG
jgi:hypothetical protein